MYQHTYHIPIHRPNWGSHYSHYKVSLPSHKILARNRHQFPHIFLCHCAKEKGRLSIMILEFSTSAVLGCSYWSVGYKLGVLISKCLSPVPLKCGSSLSCKKNPCLLPDRSVLNFIHISDPFDVTVRSFTNPVNEAIIVFVLEFIVSTSSPISKKS